MATTAENNAPRRTRPRGDARRRQILDAAITLFGERGFNRVGIAEIAAHVGITQAGLLHHFPTKAALLLAVLQERESRSEADRTRYIHDGYSFLDAFLKSVEDNARTPALVQLFALLSSESIAATHPGHDWFVNRYDGIVDRFVVEIEPLIDTSRLPPGVTVETLARWIVAMDDGLRTQWLMNPRALSRHELVAQFIALLQPYFITDQNPPTGAGTES